MIEQYVRAMDLLHRLCLGLSGLALLVISIIIPWGVYTRYVLGTGSQWPEPMAILLMIVVSFLSAALCYREHLHIGVMILPNALGDGARKMLGWVIELSMLTTNFFMLWWGLKLVETTWHQTIAEFPLVSVGLSYLPIPIGGAITMLFAVERLLLGRFFERAAEEAVATATE
jgi:TRAP-type C4-dicarboxylate transport system permease small subunit